MCGNGDPLLCSGSAAYYAQGRMPYPRALAEAPTAELRIDGSGRLLDIVCGPNDRVRFEAGLRQLLHRSSPAGIFEEETREVAVDIWQL